MIKTYFMVFLISCFAMAFGFCLRGDLIFSKMFAETVQVACGKESK